MEKIVIGSLSRISSLIDEIEPYKIVYLTNTTVNALWMEKIRKYTYGETITVPDGERYKTIDTAIHIWKILKNMEFTRKSLLIGVGGGVITDIAGFVSATYMRGTYLGFVPTTFLSQIDAAIGGKNGVNFEGKNMVGTFYSPHFVLISTETLTTLPGEELLNGIGELVKYAILNPKIYNTVKNVKVAEDVVNDEIIREAVNFKCGIVKEDMQEEGKRKILNLGHTVGHAIEKLSGYRIKHGFAVSVGLAVASQLGKMFYGFDSGKIEELLNRFHLPIKNNFPIDDILEEIKKDKKAWRGKIVFVIPEEIGKVHEVEIEEKEVREALSKVSK